MHSVTTKACINHCVLHEYAQEAVRDADLLVVCVPHQFVHGIAKQLRGKVSEDALAISLTKVRCCCCCYCVAAYGTWRPCHTACASTQRNNNK